MFNILVAEDDIVLLKAIGSTLRNNGFNVITANNGSDALTQIEDHYTDLCVIDSVLPDMSGLDFMQAAKNPDYPNMPIVVLSESNSFSNMERAFKLGADDYLIKPINPDELILRIKAILRRAKIAGDKIITVGGTTLNYDALTIKQNNIESHLPKKEFLLLYKLLSYPNKIFTRRQLMDEIWGFDNESEMRTVNVHINRLRAKLIRNPDFKIVTVRNIGYKAVLK